jgi:DNA-binding NarL/FixJ family response regulator
MKCLGRRTCIALRTVRDLNAAAAGTALKAVVPPERKLVSNAAATGEAILVVDNDPLFRAFARELLVRRGFGVAEAADGEAALSAAALRRPELVLLDVCLPRASGYEVCRELRDRFGDSLGIIFVSGERIESIDRVSGLLLGADDYLAKPFDPDELLARVRTVLRRVARPRGNGNGKALASGVSDEELTPRELEVLQLLAEGMTQPQIARRLVISPRTVGTHIQNLLGKLDVHSRAQAVALAHRMGLVALTLEVVA